MKAKILLGGILLATLATVFSPILSDKAYANGETYQWVTQTQIKASGGTYKGTTFYTLTNSPPENFAGSKASFITSGGPNTSTIYQSCNNYRAMVVINTSPDSTKDVKGTVWFGYTGSTPTRDPICGFNEMGADHDITIKAAAPTTTPGSTTDCTKLSGDAKDKCQVIKDCVNSGQGLTPTECTDAYNNCINGGNDAVIVACKKEIAKGNTDYKSIIKSANSTSTESTNTCNIPGVGWLVCPVMTFLAGLNDGMYSFLANHFLMTNIALYDTNSGTYKAWQQFRNYANIAFVIAFLFIIYSQVTSAGVGNYGIKRMLPRLIVGAILVNISYFVCQLAVDLSNILGFGLKEVFDAINVSGPGGKAPDTPTWVNIIGSVIGATVAIAATVALAIALGGTVLLAALLAFGMITLILVAREALIVLLIAISPLAFVAYLLPNTEQWFKKWWKALWTTLLVFPIIAVIFGASSLASRILMNIGNGSSGDDSFVLKLTALGVLAIPFFAVPSALKGSMSAAGTIGARLQGMGDRATGKVSSGVKKNMSNSYIGRQAAIRGKERDIRKAMVAGGTYSGRNPINRLRSRAFGGLNQMAISGSAGDRMAAQGTALARDEYEKAVKEAQQTQETTMSYDQRLNAATTGTHEGRTLSHIERDALVRTAMDSGNFDERQQVLSGLGSMTDQQRRSAINIARSKGDTGVYGSSTLGALEENAVGDQAALRTQLDAGAQRRIESGEVAPETFTRDTYTSTYLANQSTGPGVTAQGRANLAGSLSAYATTEQGQKMTQATRQQVERVTGPLP